MSEKSLKMNYDMFLGCVIAARLPFLEVSARKICNKFGIELNEVEGFSCCPDPTGIELISRKAWAALGARNLALSNANDGIVSLCAGCVNTLKSVNHDINKRYGKREINKILAKIGKTYDGSTKITHLAQILYEQLKQVKNLVTKPLKGFKIAVHYGCHYLRPSKIIKGENPLKPVSLDKIIEALGAESIPYENKMDCCGYAIRKADNKLSTLIVKQKLDNIQKSEANCIVVACPACFQQYDFNQRDINKIEGTDFNYPTFYFSELIALAFGFSYDEIGLKYHHTKVKPFLRSIKFIE